MNIPGKTGSALEARFAMIWKGIGGQPLDAEFRFHPTRKWRFDFAHIRTRTAVEIEGGEWCGGRHVRGAGYSADCEKYNEAVMLRWHVFRLTKSLITVNNLEHIARFIQDRAEEIV